jgi:hypothetical protein
VQLDGKDYVSNLVGLGFDPLLPHFFLDQLSVLDGGGGGETMWRSGRGGVPTWKWRGLADPCGRGCVVAGPCEGWLGW